MKQTATLFTDRIWGNSQAELISKTLGKQPRCFLTEHEANSHSVYWQNLKQQPRCVMIEHYQTATLFTDRTWGKQPRCFMTEHADRTRWLTATLFTESTLGKQPRCLLTECEANSQTEFTDRNMTVYGQNMSQTAKLNLMQNHYSNWMLSFKRVLSFKRSLSFKRVLSFKLDVIFQATDTRDIRLSFKPLIHGI